MATNPLLRTVGGLGLGAAALGAGSVAALASRRHAIAPETGESYLLGDVPGGNAESVVLTGDGIPLHVEVSEPPGWQEHPTVVLCHGYTLSSASWVLVRRRLAVAGYRVVAWDQRGHGRSGPAGADTCTIEDLGRDLASVLDALVPGPMALVGHSMGGMTIMALGRLRPDLVARVVAVAFVATAAGGTGELQVRLGDRLGRAAQRLAPQVLTPLGTRPGVVAAARRGARELEDAFTYRYSYHSPVPRSLLRFTADMILATPIDTIVGFLPALSAHDEHEGLEAYAGVEALVLNGVDDLLTPPQHSVEICRVLPQAEHVVVEDAGHLVMLEHPALVAEQVAALVERATRPADDDTDHGAPGPSGDAPDHHPAPGATQTRTEGDAP